VGLVDRVARLLVAEQKRALLSRRKQRLGEIQRHHCMPQVATGVFRRFLPSQRQNSITRAWLGVAVVEITRTANGGE
jgi:hypothetical protein